MKWFLIITLGLILVLGIFFLRGFSEAIGVAVGIVALYLSLNVVVLARAYWIYSTSTTTHGTGHGYDTRVPVLLFGYGIKAGEYLQPSSPIDLAPTLAFLSGITLPDAMGRVLTEALTPLR